MKVEILDKGKIFNIKAGSFSVPFVPENYGFFVYKDDKHEAVEVNVEEAGYVGVYGDLHFALSYEQQPECLKVKVKIENHGADFDGRIGFHVGVDTYMEKYPEWNDKFFPTLLRCEKTHLWGYYMNTAENALAIATEGPVASYDIQYNKIGKVPFMAFMDELNSDFLDRFVQGDVHLCFEEYRYTQFICKAFGHFVQIVLIADMASGKYFCLRDVGRDDTA